MKSLAIALSFCLFTVNTFVCFGQKKHKGYPLIKATSIKADYKIGNDRVYGSWNISPDIVCDSLTITLRAEKEKFTFYTDLDSINFELKPNEVHKFYVKLKDAYAFTAVKTILPQTSALVFDKASINSELTFWYQDGINDYLNLLRSKYSIDSLIQNAKNDTEKALSILNWVHKQWRHNGNNTPVKNDAISILEEVKTGKNFRCVEYGIVTSACLNSIGLKARTLSLKTKDVETTKYGAGHVLLEVYLNDLQKWVVLDGQWDIMPVLNNIPLNAVEFQKAITEDYNNLEIRSLSGTPKRQYVQWIYPYLYYFSFAFDNREGIASREKINGKNSLMLVPIGAKNPTIFQITSKIENCLYTNSINDFYGKP